MSFRWIQLSGKDKLCGDRIQGILVNRLARWLSEYGEPKA